MQTLLPNPAVKTHMPFATGKDGLLLFCYALAPVTVIVPGGLANHRGTPLTYAPWTLAYGRIGEEAYYPIYTGLPPDAVECSPSAWEDPATGLINLHFYGGTWAADHNRLIYRPYLMVGPSLDKLGRAVPQHDGPQAHGFWHPEMAAAEGDASAVTLNWPSGESRHYGGFEGIFRISYRAGDPEQVIITGRRAGAIGSWLLDARTGLAFEIRAVPDAAVYKCTLLDDNTAAYTVIGDASDIGRSVHIGPVTLQPVAIEQVTVAEEGAC